MKTILLSFFSTFLLIASLPVFGNQDQIKDVKVFRDGGKFVVDLYMNTPPAKNSVEVDFIRQTIQVNLPKVKIKNGKSLTRVADKQVKSVFLYEPSGRISRTRIILNKGIQAARFLHSVEIFSYADKLRITVDGEGDRALASRAGEEVSVILPVESKSNNSLIKEVKLTAQTTNTIVMPTKLPPRPQDVAKVEEAKTAKVEEKKQVEAKKEKTEEDVALLAATKSDKKEKAESEIPVFTKFKESNAKNMPSAQKILISLGVIILTFFLVAFGIKKWSGRKGYPLSTTSIKVISQHFLGPKRSIAIIQVAGESLLVGITEQNITMLKTLSLLSEEVPQTAPNSFKGALSHFDREASPFIEAGGRHRSIASEGSVGQPMPQQNAASEDENFAMAGLGEIRDRISQRLQGMKQF